MFSLGLWINILIWGFVIITLIYLVVKRVKDKKHEDFEHRNN